MRLSILICTVIIALGTLACALRASAAESPDARAEGLTFSCRDENSLYQALLHGGRRAPRFDSPAEAIHQAAAESAVILAADKYPRERLVVDAELLREAAAKKLRLYVEFPASFPGLELGEPRGVRWERGVVTSKSLDLGLPKLHLLALHDCTFLRTTASDPALVLARVAGFDTAVFGLPKERFPILLTTDAGHVVATTKLTDFVKSRYAPSSDWLVLWTHLLDSLEPAGAPHKLVATPVVHPAYGERDRLPENSERLALEALAGWYRHSRLLLTSEREKAIAAILKQGVEVTPPPLMDVPGDGSHGIMEGYASQILPDGSQLQRTPIRADCQAETAAVLALQGALEGDAVNKETAENLLDFLYFDSELCQGERGNPKHPAFGHIAWGAGSRAWQIGNYGDDNARTLLATMAAAAMLHSDKWDEPMLKALAANLRTTGKLGFRGDRVDVPPLEQNGWKFYHEQETINYSPSFEAYPWACFLWAYDKTKEPEYLEKAKTGIRMTMAVYPKGWRWGDNLDRTRMVLALAWLVRVEDTAEHRHWLEQVAGDLIRRQQPCGAIPDELLGASTGHFHAPASNEAYGTSETPLMQTDGDPVSDQLYSTNFALIGLHEAAEATHDPKLKQAEDKLVEYVVRIQTRSDSLPYLSGTWFRAFDFRRWDYWSSSGDAGWGAWCAETGWGPAWNGITIGLRQHHTSLWELTRSSKIARHVERVRELMAQNDGGPWVKAAQKQ